MDGIASQLKPCCVGGDFNTTIFTTERTGTSLGDGFSERFNQLIEDYSLGDL